MDIKKENEKIQNDTNKTIIPTPEQIEIIRNRLKGEDANTSVTLKDCIEVVDGFINGTIDAMQLEAFGAKMSIRAYIPILEKMNVLMRIIMQHEISAVESTEIKMVELYKHIFFTVILQLYGQVQFDVIQDKDLMTYENYDKLFPIFYPFIIGYCKQDYDIFMGMFNDCLNWNGVVQIVDSMENVDVSKIDEATQSNKELIDSLKENQKMVEDLKDLMLITDDTTKQAVQEIKKVTVREVLEAGKKKLEDENAKQMIIGNVNEDIE